MAFQPGDGAGAQDQHAVRGFAAQHLLPGEGDDIQLVPGQVHGEGGRGGVADGQAFAVGGDPVAIGHFHAAGGAVPQKDHVAVPAGLQLGKLAIGRLAHLGLEFQLLDRVGDPVFAETFPGKDIDLARAQQRPHRHFHRAGVRCRDNADAIVGGNAEQQPRPLDGVLQLGFAGFGAVGPSHQRALEGFRGPARALGAGTGRKKRPRGTHSRVSYFRHTVHSFQNDSASLGRRGPQPI